MSKVTMGLLVVCFSCGSALGADENETERNDTFDTRQTLAASTRSVSATLAPQIDFQVNAAVLASGAVNDHTFATTAGTEFYSWTDPANGPYDPDLAMGVFSSTGGLVGYDDDDGPIADGVGGVANPDGSIRLKITGSGDVLFVGDHLQSGSYDMFVQLGADKWVNDVDFFSFTDLLPGSVFTAEVTDGDIDSVLGLYNDAGILIDSDDDSGQAFLSKMTGIVPVSGKLTFAVSGWDDFAFSGDHYEFGDYVLNLDATAVPEPSAIIMWVMAGVFGLAIVRRRNSRSQS